MHLTGLDNSKIANAFTIDPNGETFKTQEWGQPNGWENRDQWSDATGRILEFWTMYGNADLGSATVPNQWRTSYDDGAGGWTDTGFGYPGTSVNNPHSHGEYAPHSSAGPGNPLWKAELTGPGQPRDWFHDQFGIVPTQDTIHIAGWTAWAPPWYGGLIWTLRIVYDEAIDPETIGWGYAADMPYDVLGDFTVLTPPTPGDFNDDDLINAADIDILADAIAAGSTDSQFDVNNDSFVDELDLIHHIATLVGRTDGGTGTYRGDFNLDGYVDGTDLAVLKAGFGLTGLGYASGNANADEYVDGTDLSIFKATFGFSGTPDPTGATNPPAVPEPATLGLLGIGASVLLGRRKRK
jgi:hypothetical protein